MNSMNTLGGRVTVVSGLPRSGTSMMMQMLEAGGIPILTDRQRVADDDNPEGYYEYDPVKRLRADNGWLAEACGKAVKIISFLLKELPPEHQYDIVFIRRAQAEILASQRQMLIRSGTPADPAGEEKMAAAFTKHIQDIDQWMARQPNIRLLNVEHRATLERPLETAHAVAAFLDCGMDVEAMAGTVDRRLYRQRA